MVKVSSLESIHIHVNDIILQYESLDLNNIKLKLPSSKFFQTENIQTNISYMMHMHNDS